MCSSEHRMHSVCCADCWDCEVQTTYGWIECAGLADRSAFDLTVHSNASKTDLVAYEQFDVPQEEDVVEVEPQMKVMGKALKQAAKAVVEHLTSLSDDAAMSLKVLNPEPVSLSCNGSHSTKSSCPCSSLTLKADKTIVPSR